MSGVIPIIKRTFSSLSFPKKLFILYSIRDKYKEPKFLTYGGCSLVAECQVVARNCKILKTRVRFSPSAFYSRRLTWK